MTWLETDAIIMLSVLGTYFLGGYIVFYFLEGRKRERR